MPSPSTGLLDRWVGAAEDNAALEAFFSLLKKNAFNRRSWATKNEPRLALMS